MLFISEWVIFIDGIGNTTVVLIGEAGGFSNG